MRHRAAAAPPLFSRFRYFFYFSLREQNDILRHFAETPRDQTEPAGKLRETIALGMPGHHGCRQLQLFSELLHHRKAFVAERGQRTGGPAKLNYEKSGGHLV